MKEFCYRNIKGQFCDINYMSMKESNLNTIISRSFKRLGFCHKISDPLGGSGTQKPFDGFAVLSQLPIYFETKLIKNGIYAFNFNKIEEHQITNLNAIQEMLTDSLCLIVVGFYEPRKLFEVCLFNIRYVKHLMEQGITSIKQKELKALREKGLFMPINYIKEGNKRVQLIDLDKLRCIKDYVINGTKN